MSNKDILIEKYGLFCTKEYEQIRRYQIENIIKLANTELEPLIIKGMLKNIADSDKWQSDFLNEQKK